MKRRAFLQSMGATVASASVLHAQTVRRPAVPVEIAIDPGRELGRIHPRVYGHFLEHLESCIYGGIFDPKLSDPSGLRQDVIDAIKEMGGARVLRWPGGNFASYYRWKDGIGPRDRRPRRFDVAWGQEETNGFGADEFLDLCRRLECDPFITVNMGTGDVEEACQWVEYCRRSNRQPPVRIWGLGNEMYGLWQVGSCTADEYGRKARQFAHFMRVVEKDLEFVGVGADAAWNETVLAHCGQQLNWLSIHLYGHRHHVGNGDDFDATAATPAVFEREIRSMADQLAEYERKAGRARPIAICLEEWNSRHIIEKKVVRERPRDVVDALFVAGVYNACQRLSSRVTMTNYTFPVNLHAPIMVSERGVLRSATFDVHRLYATKMLPVAIEARWTAEQFSAEAPGVGYQRPTRRVTAGRLDVSATRSVDGRRFSVAALNRHAHQPVEIVLRMKGQERLSKVMIHTLTSPDIRSVNTWERPNEVRAVSRAVAESSAPVTLPSHSVNIIELTG